jgi:hypothetical protein
MISLAVACGVELRDIMIVDGFDMAIPVPVMSLHIHLVSLWAGALSIRSRTTDALYYAAVRATVPWNLAWYRALEQRHCFHAVMNIRAVGRYMKIFGVNATRLPHRPCALRMREGIHAFAKTLLFRYGSVNWWHISPGCRRVTSLGPHSCLARCSHVSPPDLALVTRRHLVPLGMCQPRPVPGQGLGARCYGIRGSPRPSTDRGEGQVQTWQLLALPW